jgi:hypothetical protein
MTEEVKPEVQEQAPEPTPIEQQAMAMGWRPKEEYFEHQKALGVEPSEDDFIDAKEFVRRKPLYERIDQTNSKLKAVTKALEDFKNHYTKVRETEFNRALAELKNARKQALSDGDGDRFETLDDQIKTVEQQVDEVRAAQARPIVQDEPVVAPEFLAWKSKNTWYDSTSYMRKFADDVGLEMHKRGMPPADVLKEVEKAVRKEFPQKFTNPNKQQAPNVEAGNNVGKRSSLKVEMTDEEKKVMHTLVRGGHISEEDYIKDLARMKGKA